MERLRPTMFCVPGLLLGFLLVAAAPLSAQSDLAPTWPVDSVLIHYQRNAGGNVESARVFHILRYASSAARRDSLLNGLERLALSADSVRLRSAAVLWIAFAGEVDTPHPTLGIVARLARIYRANDASIIKRSIQSQLPVQAERRAATALLRALATEPDTSRHSRIDDMGDLRFEALYRLSEMGEEGRAALQAIHRSGEARSSHVRRQLNLMARHGFQVQDIRRGKP